MTLFLAVILGVGSLVGFWIFLYTGPFRLVDLQLRPLPAHLVDAGLSLLFFLQHSVMVRRFFRQWVRRVLPAPFYGALYAISSGLALLVLMIFWQASSTVLVSLEKPFFGVVRSAYFVSLAGLAWCILALRIVDPFGLQPLVNYLRGGAEAAPASFTVCGPYRWVRHPIYFFSIITLWSYPPLTSDRLLLNVLWTAWIVLAAGFEERDLVAVFGDQYREYQGTVPMLIPLKRPNARC